MKRITTLLFCIALLPFWAHAQGLKISHLKGDLYLYTTWQPISDAPYPATGMYIVTQKGVVIIDTPWDTTQIQPLKDSIRIKHHQPIVMVLATHHHADRAGGFNIYNRMGIATWSTQLTYKLSKAKNEPRAKHRFTKDTTFYVGGYPIRTFYPGEGHTKDNIVIWFEKEKVLFGGCFVKSVETQDVGYAEESDLKAWPASVDRVKKAFPGARIVIPGHLGGTSPAALDHTSNIAKGQH